VGLAIAVVVAAGNVYTGLKTGWIDGGSITAALLSFTLFSALRRPGRTPYGPLENNITQTVASSAAIMGFGAGLAGPVPALTLLGFSSPAWATFAFGAAIGLVGIFAAVLLRRTLIMEAALPFPTGIATAELIETIYSARSRALRRAAVLGAGALAGMVVTWFRDGHPRWIPQATLLAETVGGVAAGTLTFGVSWSPLMASTGVLMGLRAATSMAIGAVVGWGVLAPWLVRHHVVSEVSYSGLCAWLVWPGLGLLVAGTFVPLLMQAGTLVRSFRDLGSFFRGRSSGGERLQSGWFLVLVVLSVVVIEVVCRVAFGIHPAITFGALLLALLLANVSGRSAGETDLGPVGPVGTLTQLVFSGYGTVATVVTGWLSMGSTSQAVQTLWAFRAGERLGASPRAQIRAQVLGALLGGAVVVPVYFVIVNAYGVGTEMMPAPAAISWKATAQAVRGGLAALPPYGPMAGAIALVTGTVITLLGRTRVGRFLPSPAAMGMAMLTPAWLGFTAFGGALLIAGVRKLRPSLDEPTVMAFAAGGIAGESIIGVVIAALAGAGLL
jgi:putative OPT family oligopeptide transporter